MVYGFVIILCIRIYVLWNGVYICVPSALYLYNMHYYIDLFILFLLFIWLPFLIHLCFAGSITPN